MRVALITPEHPGCGPSFGVGRYVCDLAAGLAAAGATVRVLVASDSGCFRVLPGRAPEAAAPAVPHLLLRPLLARGFLEGELAAFRPDVAELPNWGGLGACLRSRVPTLVRLVTSAADPSHGRWGLRTPLRLALEAATVRRAALVVADSLGMARRGLQLYRRAPDAITHLAYAGPVLAPAPRLDPEVLYVGRLEPRKGIDVLLDAWPQVTAHLPAARLHVVGADLGGYAPRAAGIAGVTVHGRLGDGELAALRLRCAVQAIPSRFESFGLVALEAWAAGMAVVGTRCGGLEDVVGDAGPLVAPGDAAALAEALLAALAPAATANWAARGRRRLLARFLPGRWIATTLAQYARIRRRRG